MGLGRLADEVFEAVIFDMDGTLIDSTPAVARAWATWADEYGFTAEELAGPPRHTVRQRGPRAAARGRHAAALDRINELEIADVDDIVVLPGAAEALAALVGARMPSPPPAPCRWPRPGSRRPSWSPPSVLVTADDVARGKPHPDPFLVAAGGSGVDPTRCLVVEDAPKGLEAARAAGCFTLAVTTTTAPRATGCRRDRGRPVPGTFDGHPAGIRVRLAEAGVG